jgi:hypothetical protein
MKTLIAILLATGFTVASEAAVIRIPGDYPVIQQGIEAASAGDTVLVADGIYTGEGNVNLDFIGKTITVKSENGPESCILDCEFSARGFYLRSGETNASIIEGFTVVNAGLDGGGICCENSSPTVKSCCFTGALIAGCDLFGGGIYCENSSAFFEDCVISGNRLSGCDVFGAGVCSVNSAVTLLNCRITANSAFCDQSVGWGYGGGVYESDGRILLINCGIDNNYAGYETGIDVTVEGGGIWCGDAQMFNCLIAANTASGSGYGSGTGGGIFCLNADLVNCTVSDNTATDNGDGINGFEINCTNSILWNKISVSNSTITYSNVQEEHPGEGNISSDPLFVSGPSGEYYLSQIASGQALDSPCVDAGDTFAAQTCIEITGSQWCLSEAATRSDEICDSGIVDMGYHSLCSSEILPTPTPGQTCSAAECIIDMPASGYRPHDECYMDVLVCVPVNGLEDSLLLAVVLDAYGDFIFILWEEIAANPEYSRIPVVPPFSWPSGAGNGQAVFYACLLNRKTMNIAGKYDSFPFSWME